MTEDRQQNLTDRQIFLLGQAMPALDRRYDPQQHLIKGEDDEDERHSTRSSAHYALGLLIRGEAGDGERAAKVLERVVALQLDAPDEIYHGTFLTSPQAPLPPRGNYPWRTLGRGHAFFLDRTLEKIADRLPDEAARTQLWKAADQVLPPVWRSYDPNWREFIACCFAVILELFEQQLPAELVEAMDASMQKAVTGSIERRLADEVPMNTNIVLMHLFIVDYYGARYANLPWAKHAARQAARFLESFREFGTFAEFNSSTYYGVDLTVLGLMRCYAKSEAITLFSQEVEAGLWRAICWLYHAGMEDLCGPFSRGYEMDMRAHSSMGVFIYLALGKGYEYLTEFNCESAHDPMIALVGVNVPDEVLPALSTFAGERQVSVRYRELCERHHPEDNSYLCQVSAWLGERYMIGGISGSRNTSGQLHPATMHWCDEAGRKFYLRMLRRVSGDSWGTHYRGYSADAVASSEGLSIEVATSIRKPLEIFFEITAEAVSAGSLERLLERSSDHCWRLPGMELRLEAVTLPVVQMGGGGKMQQASHSKETSQKLQPDLRLKDNAIEIVYLCPPAPASSQEEQWEQRLRFDIGVKLL